MLILSKRLLNILPNYFAICLQQSERTAPSEAMQETIFLIEIIFPTDEKIFHKTTLNTKLLQI